MWFTGAGAPRSSGLPTAYDLIWDLKRRYYCERENQDVQAQDVRSAGVRARIQSYADGHGFPPEGSNQEYSKCFELVFGDDYGAQRAYLQEQLSADKVTLTIGQRAHAALLAMGKARIVFTTNFDEVLESAYAHAADSPLSAFHLEGSYEALDALNQEQFPLYAKIHGDFRYRSVKNLEADLKTNDSEIQKCFIAAAGHNGLIISGYSGRDTNVMAMFEEALSQPNPFPHGVWWTVPRFAGTVPQAVESFILKAREKGIQAGVVETGPYDVMLSKLWRQIPDKPRELDDKVRSARAMPVSIKLPETGGGYPILRTNALPLTNLPTQCGKIAGGGAISNADLFAKIREARLQAAVPAEHGLLFWGDPKAAAACIGVDSTAAEKHEFADPLSAMAGDTFLKSFFEAGLVAAINKDAPIVVRKRGRSFYAVVSHKHVDDDRVRNLKKAVGDRSGSGPVFGSVPGLEDTQWAEAVELRLEHRGESVWLMLQPDIWINPLTQREHARDFMRERRLRRWNRQSYEILSAWIELLFGSVGETGELSITYASECAYPVSFGISTRTCFSRREVANG